MHFPLGAGGNNFDSQIKRIPFASNGVFCACIRILSSVIKLIDTKTIRISVIYRSHNIKKNEVVHSLKKFLRDQLNTKNHCIIGDFNIDIKQKF